MTEMSVEEYRALGKPKASKYRAQKVTVQGITYDSKAEYAFALHLDLLKELGFIRWHTRQVPFYLPGEPRATRYVIDFLVVMADGTVRLVDVKGFETPVSKIKRSVIQATHGIVIEWVHRTNSTFDWPEKETTK